MRLRSLAASQTPRGAGLSGTANRTPREQKRDDFFFVHGRASLLYFEVLAFVVGSNSECPVSDPD
jgi:hypothetical protein